MRIELVVILWVVMGALLLWTLIDILKSEMTKFEEKDKKKKTVIAKRKACNLYLTKGVKNDYGYNSSKSI